MKITFVTEGGVWIDLPLVSNVANSGAIHLAEALFAKVKGMTGIMVLAADGTVIYKYGTLA